MGSIQRNQWFAIQVKSRRERAVALALRTKGYDEFLPLYQTEPGRKCGEDRVPLFPGYLFCQLNANVCGAIVTTPGVIRIIGIGSRPFPVADEEIQSIRCIINSGVPSQPWPYLRIGETVRIDQGSLSGVSGFVVRVRSRTRVVVSVTLLQRSVAVEIDSSTVVPTHGVPPRDSHVSLVM